MSLNKYLSKVKACITTRLL